MKTFIKDFPNHIENAIKIADKSVSKFTLNDISNVIISGQGGSGIAGCIVRNIFYNKISIPIIINQDYKIPKFADDKTLFISSSYSGNTEETINAFHAASKKKCQIICICSDGELLSLAKEHNYNYITIPRGGAPRAMLAYSLTQLLFVLESLHSGSTGINDLKIEMKSISRLLLKKQKEIMKIAKSISSKIGKKMPFIYTYPELEGLAVRFKQQLNENSKRHAFYNIIPEMNHNEIVGWSRNSLCSIPIFINGQSSKENKNRLDITINQISPKVEDLIVIDYDTSSHIEEYFYFLHLVDWVSFFIAENDGVDPNEIDAIHFFKKELKKL
ncbi:MAG: bifunctional phosphoglucose/phosphomannose isomerase [Flavobacteriales bacterium TMED191]|nr:MAG: bifunctional phosphoglucose/phosphomannose isomerase [Flavobacteriales bacterium TMED191]|tara:strand:+ start:53 stop:1042 length:990 start_codon:yes stop_codon:yes gene_type:complete